VLEYGYSSGLSRSHAEYICIFFILYSFAHFILTSIKLINNNICK
jgi:hypothetical protein